MMTAPVEASVLCLVALVAARAAAVLRARRWIIARGYPAAPRRWRRRQWQLSPPAPVARAVVALGVEPRTSVVAGAAGAWMVTVIVGAAIGGVRTAAVLGVAAP